MAGPWGRIPVSNRRILIHTRHCRPCALHRDADRDVSILCSRRNSDTPPPLTTRRSRSMTRRARTQLYLVIPLGNKGPPIITRPRWIFLRRTLHTPGYRPSSAPCPTFEACSSTTATSNMLCDHPPACPPSCDHCLAYDRHTRSLCSAPPASAGSKWCAVHEELQVSHIPASGRRSQP